MKDKSESNLERHGYAAILASLKRTVIGVPFEYPLSTLANLQQANPEKKYLALLKLVIQENKSRDFFLGALPFTARTFIRSSYHTAGIVYFRELYGQNSFFNSSSLTKNIFAAASMTAVSNFFVNPLERYRVFIITRKNSSEGLFSNKKDGFLRTIQKGFLSNYTRSLVSWGSFLVTEEYVRSYLLSFETDQNRKEKKLSLKGLFFLGWMTGTVNLATTLPLETIAIQIQKANSESLTMYQSAQFIFRNFGLPGFYAGWKFKFINYLVTSLFSVYAIQVANSYSKNRGNSAPNYQNHSYTVNTVENFEQGLKTIVEPKLSTARDSLFSKKEVIFEANDEQENKQNFSKKV